MLVLAAAAPGHAGEPGRPAVPLPGAAAGRDRGGPRRAQRGRPGHRGCWRCSACSARSTRSCAASRAGTGGVELVFFLLILAGRVFGPGFGFVLGVTSLFASALMTAGVGPWLPFQMLVSAWVGMGAGLLPRRVTGRAEIAMLAAYGVVRGVRLRAADEPLRAGRSCSASRCPGTRASISYVAGAPLAREPAGVPRLHADHVDRQLRHRPGDHQRGRDRGARPRRPGHPAPRVAPGDGGRATTEARA